jgi:hypothetical protein
MSTPAALERVDRLRDRRLAEFVDRSREMEVYTHVIEAADLPVMVVWAESGMGKTSLLMRMTHDCSIRKLRKGVVTWTDTLVFDYMAVMRRLRDELGAEHFAAFTDLINYYTDKEYVPKLEVNVNLQGGSVSVAQDAQISGSQVGEISGIVLRDNMIVIQRQDIPVPLEVRREQLTQHFLEGLQALSASGRVVLFFDAVEKMSDSTHQWLWQQLLTPVIEGSLPDVRAVVLGQRPPPDDRDLCAFMAQVALKPLGVQDIEAYLTKRTAGLSPPVPVGSRTELANMLLAFTGGRPGEVACGVDVYIKNRGGV